MDRQNKKIFKSFYSEFYDLIYKKKNYENESKRILNFLKLKKNVKDILELGCGTCSHSIFFSKKFNIHAIDKSPEMLEIAKNKLLEKKIKNIKLFKDDIENLKFRNNKYDAILLLFNVIGYISNLDKFFNTLKKFAKENTLLIFDFWHQDAIHFEGPKKIKKSFVQDNQELLRNSVGRLNKREKRIEILIDTVLKSENKILAESSEKHLVRYYNLDFLTETIQNARFEVIKYEDFNKLGDPPNKKNWNAYCVCKFVG